MGHVATSVAGSTTRKLVQPFVLQKRRLPLEARRRMRRIATERPATDVVVVRDIIGCLTVPSGSRDPRALSALDPGGAAGCLVSPGSGSVSGAGADLCS